MDIRIKGEEMGFPSDRDAALAARTSRKLAELLNSAEPCLPDLVLPMRNL